MKKTFLYLTLFFIFISTILYFVFFQNSSKKSKEPYLISYYFWENSYKEKIDNEKLYIKVLDIKYSNKLEIIKTNFVNQAPKDFIPVIYITNKTMQNIDYLELSNSVSKALKSLNLSFNELQIDCDWSDSSKDNFFLFLKKIKEELNITLSSTIRLHQIKYFNKTGVPPVDYGVLMYYNMSSLNDFETNNYIFDNSIAKKYHYNFDKYPLKLKLALPIYSQAVQFRDKKAVNIFESLGKSDFDENFKDFEKIENSRYKVLNSRYFKGKYIYKDDVFRLETVDSTDLQTAFKDFLNLSKNRYNEVIFYTLKYKDNYDLQEIINGDNN